MNDYSNEVIIPLKGADRVRKRPAVIFGSSNADGALAAVANIIENSSNEAKAGYGKKIIIRRFADNSFEITDQGRGIPVEYDKEEEKYSWELNFCELYAGSKFGDDNFYLRFDGLGLCSVQYVSEYMDAIIYRKDKKYTLHFEKGINIGGLKVEDNRERLKGTNLKFKLDDTVFDDTYIKYESIENRVKDYAVSNLGVSYELEYMEENTVKKKTFTYQNLSDRVRDCFHGEDLTLFENKVEFKGKQNERPCSGSVSVCMAYSKNKTIEEVYHHGRFLKHGGIALIELKKMLCERINTAFASKETQLTQANVENVLNKISIIIYTTIYPQNFVRWTNGARTAIENPIIGECVRNMCVPLIEELLEEHRDEIKKVLTEVVE